MAREFTKTELSKQQKARAQRVDHEYYNKPHPWRTQMRLLSVGIPIVALLALGALAMIPSGANVYMPGPVSTKHQIFAERCEECHEQVKDAQGKLVFGEVTDAKCNNCHDGPIHAKNQKYPFHKTSFSLNGKQVEYQAPGCATCHTEHSSNVHLTGIADRHCTQCHADLGNFTDGSPNYFTQIRSFTDGHPEFHVKEPGKPKQDNAQVKFNHSAHIGATSSVKKADGSKLTCTDCHTPDRERAYMNPIAFDMHCKSCHEVAVAPNKEFGEFHVTHATAAEIAAAVKITLSDYVLKNGGKLPGKKEKNPKWVAPKPGRPSKEPEFIESPETRTADVWIKDNIDSTLKPMFFPDKGKEGSSCVLCHIPEKVSDGRTEQLKIKYTSVQPVKDAYPGESGPRDVYNADGMPVLEKTRIHSIWFGNAQFNHFAHRVVQCTSCHAEALTSKDTADVLLPNIANCKTCHNQTGARSGCNECHLYHDRNAVQLEGGKSIDELYKSTMTKPAPAASKAAAPADSKPEATPAPKEPANAEPPKEPGK